MSFNKAKAKRNAERYLTQGKIQAAINEYRKLVDHDPRDFNTRNMLGDLYAKADNKKEAVKCYNQVADFYNRQGFAKKAIAVYNKIHRLVPDSIEVSSKLAELYRVRGSYAEARKHYEQLADHYETKGQKIEALAIWENIAELDPRNAEIYLKIADAYWADDKEREASDAYLKAAGRFAESGNYESAVTGYSRVLQVSPLDREAIEGFVRAQIELGYPEEAVKALEERIEEDPYDKETNFLLVDCYYDMDDAEAAEAVIVKMVERDPSNYHKFLKLIEVYLNRDDLDSAVRSMSMISEHMLVGGEHESLHALVEEVLARNPEHIAALRLLARYHAWLKEEGEQRVALERVAESARINDSVEDEIFALAQLKRLVPHDQKIAERLEELTGGDAAVLAQFDAHGTVPEFESYAPLSNDKDTNGSVREADSKGEAETSEYEIEGSGGQEFEVGTDENPLEAEIVTESHDQAQVAEEPGREQFEQVEAEPASVRADESDETDSPQVVAEAPQLSASDEMRLDEEIESIRFYIDQGYGGLADKSLSELEAEFGPRPELVELREIVGGNPRYSATSTPVANDDAPAEAPVAEASSTEIGESDGAEEINGQASEDTERAEALQSQQDESSEVIEESHVEEAAETADAVPEHEDNKEDVVEPSQEHEAGPEAEAGPEQHAELETEEREEAQESAESFEKYDEIGAEEEGIEEQSPGESSVKEYADETAPEVHQPTNSFENFRDELGLEELEDPVEEDAFENHYHHAVAYQEMGLVEEAIREFQDAVNAVSPNDGTRRFLNCCSLLGHCFMEKGMIHPAIVWFKRAFETTELTTDELNGLHYELGRAYQADGDFEKAIDEFEEVYAVDVDFRDVAERLEELREMAPTPA